MVSKYNVLRKTMAAVLTGAVMAPAVAAPKTPSKPPHAEQEACVLAAIVAAEGITGTLKPATVADPINGTSVVHSGGSRDGQPVVLVAGGGHRLASVSVYDAQSDARGFSATAVQDGQSFKVFDQEPGNNRFLGFVKAGEETPGHVGPKGRKLFESLRGCLRSPKGLGG